MRSILECLLEITKVKPEPFDDPIKNVTQLFTVWNGTMGVRDSQDEESVKKVLEEFSSLLIPDHKWIIKEIVGNYDGSLSKNIREWVCSQLKDINFKSGGYTDAVRRAISRDDLEFVRLALENGFDPDKKIRDPFGDFHIATRVRSAEMLKFFINKNVDILKYVGDDMVLDSLNEFNMFNGRRWKNDRVHEECLRLICTHLDPAKVSDEMAVNFLISSHSKNHFNWRMTVVREWGIDIENYRIPGGGTYWHYFAMKSGELFQNVIMTNDTSGEDASLLKSVDILDDQGLSPVDYLVIYDVETPISDSIAKMSTNHSNFLMSFYRKEAPAESKVYISECVDYLSSLIRLKHSGLNIELTSLFLKITSNTPGEASSVATKSIKSMSIKDVRLFLNEFHNFGKYSLTRAFILSTAENMLNDGDDSTSVGLFSLFGAWANSTQPTAALMTLMEKNIKDFEQDVESLRFLGQNNKGSGQTPVIQLYDALYDKVLLNERNGIHTSQKKNKVL